jgi:hypothetical protein
MQGPVRSGGKVGINADGSAVDLVLRVVLKKNGLDPKKDNEADPAERARPAGVPATIASRGGCGEGLAIDFRTFGFAPFWFVPTHSFSVGAIRSLI